MHISLVIPPITDFYTTSHRLSFLGVHGIAQALTAERHMVTVFNFPAQKRSRRKIPLPTELVYLQPYLIPGECGPTAFFSTYHRFGPDLETCTSQILQRDPELILLTCFAFAYADDTLELAEMLYEKAPQIPIIVGGAGATALPAYFLRHQAIFGVYCGEAEVSLMNLVSSISRGSPLTAISNFIPSGNKPESLVPRYTEASQMYSAPMVSVIQKHTITLSISVSRGCPKRCRFCSNFLTHGRTFRCAPIERVTKEISEILSPLPLEKHIHICFEDDNLLVNKAYFLQLLAHIHHIRPDATFTMENGIDYLLLDKELIDTLISFGMIQCNLSLGSVSKQQLLQVNRPYSFIHYEQIIQHLATRKIPTITYFICGLAGDTRESTVRSLVYLADQPTIIGISPYYAVPNLPDYRESAPFLSHPASWCKGSSAYPWNGLTTQEIITAFRLSRLINTGRTTSSYIGNPIADEAIKRSFQEKRLYTLKKEAHQQYLMEVPAYDHKMVNLFMDIVYTTD